MFARDLPTSEYDSDLVELPCQSQTGFEGCRSTGIHIDKLMVNRTNVSS